MATMLSDRLKSLAAQVRALPRRTRVTAAVIMLLLIVLLAMGPVTAAAIAVGVLAGAALAASSGLTGGEAATPAPIAQPLGPAAPRQRPALAPTANWRSIIEAVPDPIVAVDRDLMVVYANQAAHHIFTALRHGGPIALVSRSPELAEALADALDDRKPHTVLLHDRVPVERRLDATISPLSAFEAGMPALLIVLHDISERDRLAQMRADFIAHASHELRTPLAALRGFIETLQGPARDDPAARERFLGIMSTEALRMTRILDDLLSLARVEMRAHIAPTGRVGIKEALADVAEALEPLAKSAETSITLELPAQERFVRGDRDEIVQVFVNLVQNAIKYGRRGGMVTVRVTDIDSSDRPQVSIAVIDNGPGIAEEHLPRLTERFYRVDDKSSREKGGTGLGLAIVKHILNRHQGTLKIASELGHGSTFSVELPLADLE
jgi:two-component system phosphate regulon sensor histidine kinase PhoR